MTSTPTEITPSPNSATPNPAAHWLDKLKGEATAAIMAPVRGFKREYLPPLMVYLAYGVLGITAVADQFWVKKALSLSPAELAGLSVWLTLPWAIKMVFGELVDAVPIFGSQRRAYIVIGACLIATSLVLLAGVSGGWLTFAKPDRIYKIAAIMTVIGVVLQDVVADAMTTEVVPRENPDGTPRTSTEVDADLAMVQILGRLALSIGMFSIAGLAGYLASALPTSTVYLLGLIVPALSLTGAFLIKSQPVSHRAVDKRVLGGGLAFGLFVVTLGLLDFPHAQEITFVVSMAVIVTMLVHVTAAMEPSNRLKIMYAALIIFAFRATPNVGDGYRWFAIDKLGYDEAFYGVLGQIGTTLALIASWFFSAYIARTRMTSVLLWLTIAGLILALPGLILVYEGHHWTTRVLGLDARDIGIIDSAASSPLASLSMIPLLTLIAIHAPKDQRAVWFALMSSFMNLALVAGEVGTKLLNQVYVIERGNYAALPSLTVLVTIIGFLVPLIAILMWRSRVDARKPSAA